MRELARRTLSSSSSSSSSREGKDEEQLHCQWEGRRVLGRKERGGGGGVAGKSEEDDDGEERAVFWTEARAAWNIKQKRTLPNRLGSSRNHEEKQ